MSELKHNIGDTIGYAVKGNSTTCIIVSTRENHNLTAFPNGFDYLIQEEGSRTLIPVFEDDIWEFRKDTQS